jgi:hypothetical protein
MAENPRPRFAVELPQSAELDALVEAFARGDYRTVRAQGRVLERSSADEAVRRAAGALIRRTSPDPLATALVGIATLLLMVLSVVWMVRGGAGP